NESEIEAVHDKSATTHIHCAFEGKHCRGESNRFSLIQEAYAAAPGLYRFRSEMLAMEEALKGAKKVVVDHDSADSMPFYMDLREALNPSFAFPVVEEKTPLVPLYNPVSGLTKDRDDRRVPIRNPEEMKAQVTPEMVERLKRAFTQTGRTLPPDSEFATPIED
ncbi:MAG: hypothetical protein AAF514_21735, partial [Verrucomicrobiota bacterium]